jgi:hypothetical protein
VGGGLRLTLLCRPVCRHVHAIAAALNTRDPSTIILTLNTLCKLVRTVRGVGTALLPYYKTILPLINGFKNRTSKFSAGTTTHARKHSHITYREMDSSTLMLCCCAAVRLAALLWKDRLWRGAN